jgi:thiol-disulfide isomerase/thioredoxin
MLNKLFIYMICSLLSFNVFAAAKAEALVDIEGQSYPLPSLKGKWVIVNYWATWCTPCAIETPELNSFYQHKPKDVMLFGVRYEEGTIADLKMAVAKEGIKFPVLVDDPVVTLGLDGVFVMPTTFIIDPNGKVVKTIVGRTTENALSDYIQYYKKNAAH